MRILAICLGVIGLALLWFGGFAGGMACGLARGRANEAAIRADQAAVDAQNDTMYVLSADTSYDMTNAQDMAGREIPVRVLHQVTWARPSIPELRRRAESAARRADSLAGQP